MRMVPAFMCFDSCVDSFQLPRTKPDVSQTYKRIRIVNGIMYDNKLHHEAFSQNVNLCSSNIKFVRACVCVCGKVRENKGEGKTNKCLSVCFAFIKLC